MSNLSAEPSESAFETHVQLKRGTSSWEPDQQLTAGDLTSVAGPAKASCLSNVETLKGMAPSKTDSAEQWIRHRKAHEAEKNTRISLIEGYEGSAFLADLGNCLFDWKAASRRVGRSLTMAKESIKGVPEGDVKSAFDKALNDIEESHGYLRGLTMGKYAFRQKARAVLPSILGDGPRLYAGGDDQSRAQGVEERDFREGLVTKYTGIFTGDESTTDEPPWQSEAERAKTFHYG